jgi:hypothetical protein
MHSLGKRTGLMKTRLALLPTFAICWFSVANAQAAPVAVMPVHGVNLSEGQCDAIGMFFSNAFARDAHVAVSSPTETKPLWAELHASVATAQRVGASQYIELTAIRLASKVTLAGILFGVDGREIYRAETSAASLDEMDAVSDRLARALIWRQPVPVYAYGAAPQTAEPVREVPVTAEPPVYTPPGNMFGLKGGMLFPVASGRTFETQIGFQFDARLGPRTHFIEVGVGVAAPIRDEYASSGVRLTQFFMEIGGSVYLTDGSVGLYVGGGVAPGLWTTEYQSYYYDNYSSYSDRSSNGPMLPVYGQLGVTFTRDIRTRLFAEFRLSQHLLKVKDATDYQDYHPTVLALQMGVGW